MPLHDGSRRNTRRWRWVKTFFCLDGKRVCGPKRATSRSGCVICSMEINRAGNGQSAFSFEREVLRQAEGCELYLFDPCASEWPELRLDTGASSRAHSLPHKTGAIDIDAAYPSLQHSMEQLGHPFIDILTISIDGSELAALTAGIGHRILRWQGPAASVRTDAD
ncbi:hypothetical protein MSAN_00466300 [Mycena sanguinolenta]|uniref:Uncharacterized protein n=1 Tax=Mycena sanguinolenta TaxID=230812 RepID=A0A8H6ZDN7_9AGAR|nr:hypothetical protein MSAN_00466300 [Mycena sanguinolenta]